MLITRIHLTLIVIALLFWASQVVAEGPKPFESPVMNQLVLPRDMELSGGERREVLSSDIGEIELRWERKIERFFVRTPERAVLEVARIVRRVLSSGAFPSTFSKFKLDWSVVFFDEHIPSGQIPLTILNGCHPGWMVGDGKSAHIYIRAKALAAGCDGQTRKDNSIAESALIQVLLHEFGHGVEHVLVGSARGVDRLRAEGFATWFEQYASAYSSDLNQSEVRARLKKLSQYKAENGPGLSHFDGSPYDYAYASMIFLAIEDRFGVRGLLDLYRIMQGKGVPFLKAVDQRYRWDAPRVQAEVERIIK